jgi:hypothetical protein
MAIEELAVLAQERLRKLEGDPRAAQLRKGIRRGTCDDERALGQPIARAVVVGHDDVEPAQPGVRHLVDRRDPAVDGEDEAAAVLGETRERAAADAVALVEPARQMPFDVCAELPERQHGERGGADAVRVVVAVNADSSAVLERAADRGTGRGHVAEAERVVRGLLGLEKRACRLEVTVAPPQEHAGRDVAHAERAPELDLRARGTRTNMPAAGMHGQPRYAGRRTNPARGEERGGNHVSPRAERGGNHVSPTSPLLYRSDDPGRGKPPAGQARLRRSMLAFLRALC